MTTESVLRLPLLPAYSTLNQIEALSEHYEANLMDALKADEAAKTAFFEVSKSEQSCFSSVPVLQRVRDGVIQSSNLMSENAPHFDDTQVRSLVREIVFAQNVKNLRSRVLDMTSNLSTYLDEKSEIGIDISTCLKKVVSGIASYVKDQRGLSPDEREDMDQFLLQSPGVHGQSVMSECFSEALQIVEALGDSDDPLDHDLLLKLLFGNDLPLDESPISTHFAAACTWLERLANSEKLRDHELLFRVISKQDAQGDTVVHKHKMLDQRIVSWLLRLNEMAQDESRELLYKTLSTKNGSGESFFHSYRLQSFIPVLEKLLSAEDKSADEVYERCLNPSHAGKLLSGNEVELKALLPLLLKMVDAKFERHRQFVESILFQKVDGEELALRPENFKNVLPILLKCAISQDATLRNFFIEVVSRSSVPLIHQHLQSFYPLLRELKQSQKEDDRLFLSRLYAIADSNGQTLEAKMRQSKIYKI